MDSSVDITDIGTWEPPFIQPHKMGALNKFGQRTLRDNICREVFGVPVNDLVRRYGSPVFVVGEISYELVRRHKVGHYSYNCL